LYLFRKINICLAGKTDDSSILLSKYILLPYIFICAINLYVNYQNMTVTHEVSAAREPISVVEKSQQ